MTYQSVTTAHQRRTRGALAAGAVLLTAACGGEQRLSKSAYEQHVQAAYAQVRAAFRETANAPSLEDLAARVATAQAALRKASHEVALLRAPKNAAGPNADLAEALRAYADDLDELRRAAAAGDTRVVRRFESGNRESIDRIERAAEELAARGYRLGALAPG